MTHCVIEIEIPIEQKEADRMLLDAWKKSILYTTGAISVAYDEAKKTLKRMTGEEKRKPAKKAA